MLAAASASCHTGPHVHELSVMNVDCDNVFSPTFVEKVMAELDRLRQESPRFCESVTACSNELATTGRVSCWLSDFINVGGYDCEDDIAPSGCQDVDLKLRLKANAVQFGNVPFVSKKKPQSVLVSVGAGMAFPNDPDRRRDRNEAKTANVAPEYRSKYKSWKEMNDHNWAAMDKKQKERTHSVRNTCAVTSAKTYLDLSMTQKVSLLMKALAEHDGQGCCFVWGGVEGGLENRASFVFSLIISWQVRNPSPGPAWSLGHIDAD